MMNEETTQKTCPKCKSEISADAPGGLCPHCLLQFVAMSTGGTDFPIDDRSPPDIEAIQVAFPQLEILERIGQGGMGVVYRARQPKLDRIVALKILPLRLAREPLFAERFEREGRLLARLNHPNIVGVYDFGQTDGLYFLIMEHVDGVNLRQAFASARFTPQQALSVIPKICEALQFAHDEGVLHRDIKPENILLDTKGRVKIADFGIAKFSGVDDKTGLTATGATIGTPHYMAPEQVEQPANVDHRADIFSLGVVFYEMLTGELPLGRFSAPSERAKSLDIRIDNVVMRALEKDRERRQQSANEVRTQVESLSSNSVPLSNQSHAASKPPILSAKEADSDFSARPTIAIVLILASILSPIATAMQHDGPNGKLVFWLALLSAWLSVPGTAVGIRHLVYLSRSGNRQGLKRTVVASMFWPSVLFLLWTQYFSDGIAQRFAITSPAERFSLSMYVLIFSISITLIVIWFVVKQIQRMKPNPNYSSSIVSGDMVSAVRFLLTAIAVITWIFFGLIIAYCMPGSPSKTAAIVYGGIQSPTTPELVLDIDQVTTKENVLLVVVKNLNSVNGEGMGGEGGMSGESVAKLQVEFRGNDLLPEAQVLASESFDGKCFFPNEPLEIVSFASETGITLAFALPDSASAIACMNKIKRVQDRLRKERDTMGGMMGMGTTGSFTGNSGPLFSINSSSFTTYEAVVTVVR